MLQSLFTLISKIAVIQIYTLFICEFVFVLSLSDLYFRHQAEEYIRAKGVFSITVTVQFKSFKP